MGAAAMAVVVLMLALRPVPVARPGEGSAVAGLGVPVAGGVTKDAGFVATTKTWSASLLDELHRHKREQVNQRPGPLTTAPVDAVAEDPALAAHLDSAERVLTEVSHVDGPLPQETRAQVHSLLLENAVYRQSAELRGDMATAVVIDDLGRVLISLDAEPQAAAGGAKGQAAAQEADAFRLQLNIGGVLLDLRILHHNDAPKQ